MKTLKILTAVCLVALVSAIIFGAGTKSKSGDLYAENPESDKQQTEDQRNSEMDVTEKEEVIVEGYDIGDVATDFNLQDVSEKFVSLEDFPSARGFVVIFTCNHCPYSKAYEDRIIAIDKEYKKKGYPVIAINPNNPEKYPDDSFANMKKRSKEKGFTFPYLFDANQEIYPQYGATKTPHVFLLQNENNQNIVRYIGAIDDNHQDAKAVKNHYLKNALDQLISGKDIANKKTVAIGCSIKA